MLHDQFDIKGLTDRQVRESGELYGYNKFRFKKDPAILITLRSIVKDPMVVLLLLASVIYFINGSKGDGFFMISAIILVSLIGIYQDSRSHKALRQLKEFNKPFARLIRNGEALPVKAEEIVIGDCMILEEGASIPADGKIIQSNDFAVNESILTGEAFAVEKNAVMKDNNVYSGTTVTAGLAIAEVYAIGNKTKLGQIGKALSDISVEKTPLEKQLNAFVSKMIIAGVIVFAIVWAINFSHSHDVLDSLLKALTLAMSILPEEIPVAITTFMAMSAWRLMNAGIIVKQIRTVETLGSATIICTDKTGTITQNKMSLDKIFATASNRIISPGEQLQPPEKDLIISGMWASEPVPFDPMEIALHNTYPSVSTTDERKNYHLIHEYPLGGKPPMMTHVFENSNGKRIIAAKGAPEALLALAVLSPEQRISTEKALRELTQEGSRVLAVATATWTPDYFPLSQQEFEFDFKGLISFYDPPKHNIRPVLQEFYNAGIKVKIVTGDNAATTAAIARQVGFKGYEKAISGEELMAIPENELSAIVNEYNIFNRMFPEAKKRIIEAFKRNGEIIAMTGDGVNDGPALKTANIGIAMGKKGSAIAKDAASLILLEDDLSKMVNAIAEGRRMYANLKKAIQYIVSIHIPIILTVLIPLLAGWVYPNIFSPVHIIFLELIMGPTCSIVYENEPMEKNAMTKPPRQTGDNFFKWRELFTSILQGLVITAGTMVCYTLAVYLNKDENSVRTMIFITLITANIMLTLVNRSFYYSVFTTAGYKNKLIPLILLLTLVLTALIIYMQPFNTFFELEPMNFPELFMSIAFGLLSVAWYEVVKWNKRRK